MKILHVGTMDAAGAGWHCSQAMNQVVGVESKTLFTQVTFIAAESDFRSINDVSRSWLETADVIFWHVGLDATEETCDREEFRPYFDKRAVLWFNGSTRLRISFPAFRDRWPSVRKMATTPDLCGPLDAFWAPACIAGWFDAGHRPLLRQRPREKELILVHHPTHPDQKSTQILMGVMDSCKGILFHIQNGVPLMQSLMEKGIADIHFDHMNGYFGLSSQEASVAGACNIVALDKACRDAFEDQFGRLPPWLMPENRDELRSMLQRLAADPDAAKAQGEASRFWYRSSFRNEIKANRLLSWLKEAA